MTFSKDKRQETVIYLVLWGLLFMAPIMSLYIRTTNDTSLTFNWDEVLMVWREYGVFFAVFLVHNYLLAPLLVHKQQKLIYFSIVIALVALKRQLKNPSKNILEFVSGWNFSSSVF